MFIAFLCVSGVQAQRIVYNKKDSVKVVELLTEGRKQPADTNWMMYYAKKFMGIPYVGHTLDKEKEEKLVVNLTGLDCTTFVETVLALSKCSQNGKATFKDYCYWLRQIRYRGGNVAYTDRQHYFTTWMEENQKQGITRDIQASEEPFSAVQTVSVNYMTTHVGSYAMLKAHPEWKKGIAEMEKSINGKKYRYIPKSALKPTKQNNAKLRKYIKDGDIIAIITSINGLDTSHIGLAHWKSDGLHLINASSVHHKVVDEPMLFYDYMQKHPSQKGIRLCRMTNK